jgi:YHS domain-containing protein
VNLRQYPRISAYQPKAVFLHSRKKEVINMAIDPICKMEVDEETAQYKSEYKGKTYYFCAPGCKKKFDENPDQYAKETEE